MNKKVRNILSVVLLLVAAGCGVYLFQYYYKSAKNEKEFDKVAELIQEDSDDVSVEDYNEDNTANTELSSEEAKDDLVQEPEKDEDQQDNEKQDSKPVNPKYHKVYEYNKDFAGWLTIPDTNIDYPVMYTPNDKEYGEYYIHRDFEGNYSAAGVPFIDYSCDPFYPTDNVIIYGHNMKTGTMFHDLLLFAKKDFYESHKTFRFDTIYCKGEYEIVATFYGEIFDKSYKGFKYYEFVNAADEKEFNDFVKNIKNMSIFDTGVDVQYGDKLLTLSTCAYHVEDGRFAIVAKKIGE